MRRAVECLARAAVLMVLAGCYTYTPIETGAPPLGHTVAFVISDRGRVGLAERLGPGVGRIEARVVGDENDQFIVEVFRVAQINGESSLWSGETMRLDRDFVGHIEGRQISKTRTLLLAAGAATALGVVIASSGLTGFWSEEEPPPPPPPPVGRLVPRRATP